MKLDEFFDPLQDEIFKVVFPEWAKQSRASHDFRGYILDKHTVIENIMNLLSEQFTASILDQLDFSKKVSTLEKIGILDKKLKPDNKLISQIYEVNNYRVAQAHIKKENRLRDPNHDNVEHFQEISTIASAELIKKLIVSCPEIYKKLEESVQELINNSLSAPK